MLNSYFNLQDYDVSNYTVKNIFQKGLNKKLSDAFISDNEEAWVYVIIQDNLTLEQISYNNYGTGDYWDLLFVINQMLTPFDLPKSSQVVDTKTDESLANWLKRFPSYPEHLRDLKEQELKSKFELENEKHRNFRLVKESHLTLLFEALNESN